MKKHNIGIPEDFSVTHPSGPEDLSESPVTDVQEDTRRRFYREVIRSLLFLLPPETAHNLIVRTGNIMSHIQPLLDLVETMYQYEHESLELI